MGEEGKGLAVVRCGGAGQYRRYSDSVLALRNRVEHSWGPIGPESHGGPKACERAHMLISTPLRVGLQWGGTTFRRSRVAGVILRIS